MGSANGLTFYLKRLQTLRLIERRLPVTLTVAKQRKSRNGRYHLSDPWFRFYFRFILPHQRSLLRPEETLSHIQKELRPFVAIGFEQLCQQWTIQQARTGALPFMPEAVGSHWSRRVQVDVVAINHQKREILLGECKWGTKAVGRAVVNELITNKTEKVRTDLLDSDEAWKVTYAIFARGGLTAEAKALLDEHNGMLVTLSQLEAGLP